jgi:hypothetical protein
MSLTVMPSQPAYAVIPIAKIIKEGIKKVIKAVDLMVQRLQTKTIWLQNAQKVLENKLSKLKLKEIAEWTDKQRKLYKQYYDELWKVRNTIALYERIRQILNRQVQLVDEYKRTWSLLKEDNHFTKSEIEYMYRVYTGILNASLYNLDQLMLITNSFKTQMSDAKRLEIINQAGEGIEMNYADLKQFNAQNIALSLNRAKTQYEIDQIKKLYGI